MAGWALQSPECIDLVDVVSNATEHEITGIHPEDGIAHEVDMIHITH
ncbi:MAG TPA: hypothetical protein VGO08_09550 [Burkholderiales bacterium]|nr:hypothetical protein [Burkholderiales bacterium]